MRTSMYAILCIVIRVGAVVIAVSTIAQVIPAFSIVAKLNEPPGSMPASVDDILSGLLLGVLGAAVGMLILAAMLWIYPGVIARIGAGRASEQVFESPLSSDELQRIALSVVGICYVMSAIGGLVFYVARVLTGYTASVGFAPIFWHQFPDIADVLVRIVLGLALAMESKGLVGMLHRLRGGGPFVE